MGTQMVHSGESAGPLSSLAEDGDSADAMIQSSMLQSVPAPSPNSTEAPSPPDAPPSISFYVYRAQSSARYQLENVNIADLPGVLWYLHHEVIPATPRKYHIDRIRRYKLTLRTTQEFWNVHHTNFAPFFAYDGGRCTTPSCLEFYHQYGFLVGCQRLRLKEGAYMSKHDTNHYCEPGSDQCRAPLWFSLPGPCPHMGLHYLKGNHITLDVNQGKSAECLKKMPGGLCKGPPTGAPDCTYSIEDAGEILLDDLAGIDDYNDFWNLSYAKCHAEVRAKKREGPCIRNTEYSGKIDKGVGCSFWDGKLDKKKCMERTERAKKLFKDKFPEFPDSLDNPVCDFDMIYQDEFTWPVNHTGGVESNWWKDRM